MTILYFIDFGVATKCIIDRYGHNGPVGMQGERLRDENRADTAKTRSQFDFGRSKFADKITVLPRS